MSYEIRACRICHEQDDTKQLHKYGTRHYAHWACYFAAYLRLAEDCRRFLESLHTHEIGAMPVFIFASHYRGKFDQPEWKARYQEAVDLVHKVWKRKQREDAKEMAALA